MNFRPIDLEKDYPTLEAWWKGHGSAPVPKYILPRGWIAEASGIQIAASFLYVAEGKIAVIEWTTTNPKCAMGPDLVNGVKGLYQHLEDHASANGCVAMISFVEPERSEERILKRMGYLHTPDSKPHRMLAKPVGGKVTCQ